MQKEVPHHMLIGGRKKIFDFKFIHHILQMPVSWVKIRIRPLNKKTLFYGPDRSRFSILGVFFFKFAKTMQNQLFLVKAKENLAKIILKIIDNFFPKSKSFFKEKTKTKTKPSDF